MFIISHVAHVMKADTAEMGLTWLRSNVSVARVFAGSAQRASFQAYSGVGIVLVLVIVGWRASVSPWLLATDHP